MGYTNDFYMGCAVPTLPQLPGTDGCTGRAAPLLSEIRAILVLPLFLQAPESTTDTAHVAAVVDNTQAGNNTGKWLQCTGETTVPTDTTVVLGKVHTVVAAKRYAAALTIIHQCEGDIFFAAALSRNWTGFRFWLYTVGGVLIGGATGIRPDYITGGKVYGRGSAVELSQITIQWASDGDAPRNYLPGLFGESGTGLETNYSVNVARQAYPNQSTATLVWTQDGGQIQSPLANNLWVFQNGQKLDPTLSTYSVTLNTSPGQSTITISALVHYEGANYEVFAFSQA